MTDEPGTEGGELLVPDATGTARPDPRLLPAGAVTRFAPGADGFPPPRPPRQRAVHVGDRAGDRRPGDPAHRGPRPAAVPAGARGGAAGGPGARWGWSRTSPRSSAFRAGPTPFRQSSSGPSTRRRWSGCAGRASCTPAPARGRRSRRTRRSAGGRGAGSGAREDAGRWRSPRTAVRACGWPWARARSAGWTSWPGPCRTSPRPAATCWSATAWATGRTRSAWSSTTCGRTSTSSSAGGTSCTRPRSSCGWRASSAARRRRGSCTTRWSAGRPAGSCPRRSGDTAVRSLLDAGATPAGLFGRAARLAGLQRDDTPIDPADLARPFSA